MACTVLTWTGFDALPVAHDHQRWSTEFLRTWPPGSPAHHGYYPRIHRGTWLTLDQAARGDVRCRGPD
jgi:hypothetical protein